MKNTRKNGQQYTDNLDFKALFGISEQKPLEAPYTAEENERAVTLLRERENVKYARQRAQEAYDFYQDNIKISEQLQGDILKGVRSGESVYSLFLKAARVISAMTGDRVFFQQIEEETRAIYGAGLGEKDPLRKDLEDTRARLERLEEAQTRVKDPSDLQQIKAAVMAHKARISSLEKQLAS